MKYHGLINMTELLRHFLAVGTPSMTFIPRLCLLICKVGVRKPTDRIWKLFQMSWVKRADARLFIIGEDLHAGR